MATSEDAALIDESDGDSREAHLAGSTVSDVLPESAPAIAGAPGQSATVDVSLQANAASSADLLQALLQISARESMGSHEKGYEKAPQGAAGVVPNSLHTDVQQQQQQQQHQQQQQQEQQQEEEEEEEAALEVVEEVVQLQKFLQSDNFVQRLYHTCLISEATRKAGYAASSALLLPLCHDLVEDEEPEIRRRIAEQMAQLVQIYSMEKDPQARRDIVYLVNLEKLLLVDEFEEVQVAAEHAFIDMASYAAVTDADLELIVVEAATSLALSANDEGQRISAATILTSFAGIVSRGVMEGLVIPHLVTLAADSQFQVRKAVVMGLARCCRVMASNQECLQKSLLPLYLSLSEDPVWAVRVACAEAIVDMADAVGAGGAADTAEARGSSEIEAAAAAAAESAMSGGGGTKASTDAAGREEASSVDNGLLIAAVMEQLARDPSSWVRDSALQLLGPLLSLMRGRVDSLLSMFKSMAEPFPGDNRLPLYCAFNFPAVVQSLGAERWGELSATYQLLLASEQAAVRKTIACSLHEVARLIGCQQAVMHLVPAFQRLVLDVDEVRLGMLKNIVPFLSMLPSDTRVACTQLLPFVMWKQGSVHLDPKLAVDGPPSPSLATNSMVLVMAHSSQSESGVKTNPTEEKEKEGSDGERDGKKDEDGSKLKDKKESRDSPSGMGDLYPKPSGEGSDSSAPREFRSEGSNSEASSSSSSSSSPSSPSSGATENEKLFAESRSSEGATLIAPNSGSHTSTNKSSMDRGVALKGEPGDVRDPEGQERAQQVECERSPTEGGILSDSDLTITSRPAASLPGPTPPLNAEAAQQRTADGLEERTADTREEGRAVATDRLAEVDSASAGTAGCSEPLLAEVGLPTGSADGPSRSGPTEEVTSTSVCSKKIDPSERSKISSASGRAGDGGDNSSSSSSESSRSCSSSSSSHHSGTISNSTSTDSSSSSRNISTGGDDGVHGDDGLSNDVGGSFSELLEFFAEEGSEGGESTNWVATVYLPLRDTGEEKTADSGENGSNISRSISSGGGGGGSSSSSSDGGSSSSSSSNSSNSGGADISNSSSSDNSGAEGGGVEPKEGHSAAETGSSAGRESGPSRRPTRSISSKIRTRRQPRLESCWSDWHLRHLLARQLREMAALLNTRDIARIIVPLTMDLCRDPVAEVRSEAAKQVGILLALLAPSALLQPLLPSQPDKTEARQANSPGSEQLQDKTQPEEQCRKAAEQVQLVQEGSGSNEALPGGGLSLVGAVASSEEEVDGTKRDGSGAAEGSEAAELEANAASAARGLDDTNSLERIPTDDNDVLRSRSAAAARVAAAVSVSNDDSNDDRNAGAASSDRSQVLEEGIESNNVQQPAPEDLEPSPHSPSSAAENVTNLLLLLVDGLKQLGRSKRHRDRQMFSVACVEMTLCSVSVHRATSAPAGSSMAEAGAAVSSLFLNHFFHLLLDLTKDKVANVRARVAQGLGAALVLAAVYESQGGHTALEDSPLEAVQTALKRLLHDEDRDVSMCAHVALGLTVDRSANSPGVSTGSWKRQDEVRPSNFSEASTSHGNVQPNVRTPNVVQERASNYNDHYSILEEERSYLQGR